MLSSIGLTRVIDVVVDKPSWKTQPIQFRHSFPRVLGQLAGPCDVNILLMLLRLGELTTPSLSAQSGVAKLWPLLRYLHILSDLQELRLRTAWKDVDPHQKSVASDDFGVGLGMTVLYRAFDYTECVDGRAFLHRLAQLGALGGAGATPPKVGSMKMADFVALDQKGKVHLIECKGTQHSTSALTSALEDGVQQKQSLICSSPGMERRLIGQRLVVGTLLTHETAKTPTRVLVVDPAPDGEEMVLQPRAPQSLLAEAAMRLDISRAVGAAVAERTARVLSLVDRPMDGAALEGPEQRQRAQQAFSEDEPNLTSFEAHGEYWLGERVVVPLLEPLQVQGAVFKYALLTKAVSKRLLGEVRQAGQTSVLFQEQYPETAGLTGKVVELAEGSTAAIIRPGISLAEVTLMERRAQ